MTADEIVAGGEAYLQHLVDTEEQEGLQLDFKAGQLFKGGSLDLQSAKISLAGSLSSFSNSAGGVLVIGVDCRKKDGVDCALKLVPVENIAKALTTMTEFVADALHPRHDGISVRAIPSAIAPGAGYLIVDAPRSSRRPHMNQFEKTYYKRAGSSKFRMEHYDVEDAFRRQTGPELVLEHDLRVDESLTMATERYPLVWTVACTNTGAGSARHITMRYVLKTGLADRNQYFAQPPADHSVYKGAITCAFPAEVVLHPGATRALRSFFIILKRQDGQYIWPWGKSESFEFTIETSAEGMRPTTTVLRLMKNELTNALIIRA